MSIEGYSPVSPEIAANSALEANKKTLAQLLAKWQSLDADSPAFLTTYGLTGISPDASNLSMVTPDQLPAIIQEVKTILPLFTTPTNLDTALKQIDRIYPNLMVAPAPESVPAAATETPAVAPEAPVPEPEPEQQAETLEAAPEPVPEPIAEVVSAIPAAVEPSPIITPEPTPAPAAAPEPKNIDTPLISDLPASPEPTAPEANTSPDSVTDLPPQPEATDAAIESSPLRQELIDEQKSMDKLTPLENMDGPNQTSQERAHADIKEVNTMHVLEEVLKTPATLEYLAAEDQRLAA